MTVSKALVKSGDCECVGLLTYARTEAKPERRRMVVVKNCIFELVDWLRVEDLCW